MILVDPKSVVRLRMDYSTSTGRNFNEMLRCLDALKLSNEYPIHTPANWRVGEMVLVAPEVDDATADATFPKGVFPIKPNLRLTSQPDLP